MHHISHAAQIEFLIDTDGATQRGLSRMALGDVDKTVMAGIEHARRVTELHTPVGSMRPTGKWGPDKTFGCCAKASCKGGGPKGGLFEHCKGAEHIAAEFGMHPDSAQALAAVATLLHRSKLSYRLPEDLDERGLKGVMSRALNDSWLRTYRNAPIPERNRLTSQPASAAAPANEPASDLGLVPKAPKPQIDETRRLALGMKSSSQVFAERGANRARVHATAAASNKDVAPVRRMALT